MNSRPESEGLKKHGAGNEAMIGAHGMRIYADEPLIAFFQRIIQLSVRILAILMTGVILWGIGDVI